MFDQNRVGLEKACIIDGTPLKSLLGKEVDGYRLIEEIWVRDRTVVVKAMSLTEGDFVAIKFLTQYSVVKKPELARQFEIEANVLKYLSTKAEGHRIVPFRGFNKKMGWIATTYLPGKTLDCLGRHDKKWVINVLNLLCEPLMELHNLEYVHCDIKPGNIILSNKKIRLLDFGTICRIGLLDNGCMSKKYTLGSPGFISPEQIAKKGEYGPQTDIFSLGCTILSLLTNRKYRGPETLAGVIQHWVKKEPQIFDCLFVKFLYKCIALNPEDRFSSIAEFQSNLLELT